MRTQGLRSAAARILPPLGLIVLPIVAYVNLFRIALATDTLAQDFHNEIYYEAKDLLQGNEDAFAAAVQITPYSNHVWPPLVGYLAVPFTALSPTAADILVVIVGLVCFGAALWTVGVRDWRVYGAASLWGPVIGEMRTAHLTLILCLLVAIVWRTRDRTAIAGFTLGVVVGLKFFLWPLAVWLASLRRWREAAIAAATAAASTLLLLFSIGFVEYARVLRWLGERFDQDGFHPCGILSQSGVASPVARVAGLSIGIAVLVWAWRRRSFALFVAAALLLSPIVWLDYFAVTAIPLAVARPRFSWIWLLPVLTFGIPSAGIAVGVPRTAWVVAVFVVVVWSTVREERASERAPRLSPVLGAAA